jgi:hypothetical protein
MKSSLRQTVPPGVGKTSPNSFGARARRLLAEDAHRLAGESNLSSAGGGLGGDELSAARPSLDDLAGASGFERPVA